MPYAQIIFISAKTGQRLPKLFENIDTVIENQTLRIQTGVLNEILFLCHGRFPRSLHPAR